MRALKRAQIAIELLPMMGLLVVTAAGETPISTCGTLIQAPGSYVLTQNLTPAMSTCITIASPGVTLDLNGFGIIEDLPVHSGTGITDAGVKYYNGVPLTIRNGFMKGLRSGVHLVSDHVVISDLRFSDIAEHAVIVATDALVERCSFRLVLDQTAIQAADGLRAQRNVLDGAGVLCQSACQVSENSIGNTASGIHAGDAADVNNNALYNIGADGIVVGGAQSSVHLNTMTGQDSTGQGGAGTGILAGNDAIIDTNRVFGFDVGISVQGRVSCNNCSSVTNVLVARSRHSGIVAGPGSSVTNSTSSGNGAVGIQFIGPGSSAINNLVVLNMGVAIDCTSGTASVADSNFFSGNVSNNTTCLDLGNRSF